MDYRIIKQRYSGKLFINEELRKHTTIKVGGTADLFCVVQNENELIEVIGLAKKCKIPFVIIGCGSNIIASDEGFRGLVIKNVWKDEITEKNCILTASSGVLLQDVVYKSEELSLTGAEFLTGIPGTLGGAIYMNAGAFGKEMKDILDSAIILKNNGKIETVDKSYFNFKYRNSSLKRTGDIVLKANLKLSRGNRKEISEKINEILKLRKEKHPEKNVATAGCFFKNIPSDNFSKKVSAGYLLDKIDAKNERIGCASVFCKHANIIINEGNATFEDIIKLTEKLKKRVKEKFNIELEREVQILHPEKGFK